MPVSPCAATVGGRAEGGEVVVLLDFGGRPARFGGVELQDRRRNVDRLVLFGQVADRLQVRAVAVLILDHVGNQRLEHFASSLVDVGG